MTKLLPCPFCESHELSNVSVSRSLDQFRFEIQCQNCNIRVTDFDEDMLFRKWNRRPPEKLKIEVGKVYELDYKGGRRALIINHGMCDRYRFVLLDEEVWRGGLECDSNGMLHDEYIKLDSRRPKLVCLSENQSREIVL